MDIVIRVQRLGDSLVTELLHEKGGNEKVSSVVGGMMHMERSGASTGEANDTTIEVEVQK